MAGIFVTEAEHGVHFVARVTERVLDQVEGDGVESAARVRLGSGRSGCGRRSRCRRRAVGRTRNGRGRLVDHPFDRPRRIQTGRPQVFLGDRPNRGVDDANLGHLGREDLVELLLVGLEQVVERGGLAGPSRLHSLPSKWHCSPSPW